MCDEYDNRGCEVVDELHLVITNLEMDISGLVKEKLALIADLKKEFVEDLDEIVEWCKYLPVDSEINIRLGRKIEKWEVK